MRVLIVALVGLVVLGLGLVIASNRPNADEAAARYRQALMTVLDGSTDPLLRMQRGELAYNPDVIRRHAAQLPVLSSMVSEAFARDTRAAAHLNSAALAYVWSDPVTFGQDAQHLQNAASALQRAAQDGAQSEIASAIRTLGAACVECHRQFRAP
jgi:cytochrome c556